MLVDSVGMITDTLTNILQPLGFYRIYSAKSAEEALGIIGDGKSAISLVISMWRLKAMSGAQLAESLRPSGLPIILIVDKIDKIIDEKAKQAGVTALLQQPLDIKSASRAIEAALAPFIDEDEEALLNHLQEGRQAARKQNHMKAVEEFKAALAIKHDDDVVFNLAESLRSLGGEHSSQAEKTYMAFMRNQPEQLRGYLGLGSLYYANQRPKDALKVLTLALNMLGDKDPEDRANIMLHMGEAELMLKRLPNALNYFDQAVASDPDNTQITLRAADALVGVGALEESERFYHNALEKDNSLAHVYNRLGIIYRRQKKFDQALELYTKALEYSPQDENLLYNMARSMWEMEYLTEAEAILTNALAINPQFEEAAKLLQAVKMKIKPPAD